MLEIMPDSVENSRTQMPQFGKKVFVFFSLLALYQTQSSWLYLYRAVPCVNSSRTLGARLIISVSHQQIPNVT